MVKEKHIPMAGTIQNYWTPSQCNLRTAQERAKEDLHQQIFGFSASHEVELKENPNKFATVQEKGIDPFLKTRCPFCLCFHPITKFLITKYDKKGNNKGYNRGSGKCPECGQGMQLKTLVSMRKWTIEDPVAGVKLYAAWVYEYRKSGFFQKIKFAEFNSMLKSMKWSREFWDHYKRLKGDLPTEEEKERDDAEWAAYEKFGASWFRRPKRIAIASTPVPLRPDELQCPPLETAINKRKPTDINAF